MRKATSQGLTQHAKIPVGMDDQGSGLRNMSDSLALKSVPISFLSSSGGISFTCPSSCHFLGAFPSKCSLSYDSDLLSNLNHTGVYSLHWVKTDRPGEADSPSLVIEM